MFESKHGIPSFDFKNSRFSSTESFDEAIPDLKTWASPDNVDRLAYSNFGKIHHFDILDSTNQYLLLAARQGAKQGLVAWADEQSQGRGRKARHWIAPKGASLLVSLLFRPTNLDIPLFWFSALVAEAAAETSKDIYGIFPKFKWPNDLMIDGFKLGGILTEIDWMGSLPSVVVGLGLNLNLDDQFLEAFPPQLRSEITSIKQLNGKENKVSIFLEEFLLTLDKKYSALIDKSHFFLLKSLYRKNCSTLGSRVKIEMDDGEILEGIASDIDDEGRLLVEVGMCIKTVSSGEVFHLRLGE